MTEAEVTKVVHDHLHNIGYKAEIIEDDAVGSFASGLRFYVQSYEESIQFRCFINLEPDRGEWLKFTNEFNKEFRFVKVYMYNETSLLLESDWLFDADSANSLDQFRSAMDFWEISLSALRERMRQHATPASAQNEETSTGPSTAS